MVAGALSLSLMRPGDPTRGKRALIAFAIGLGVFAVLEATYIGDRFADMPALAATSYGPGLGLIGLGAFLMLIGAYSLHPARAEATQPIGVEPAKPDPGWYPFPAGATDQQRCWDGTTWTERIRRRRPITGEPPPASS